MAVYPRVGGGNLRCHRRQCHRRGLSPRGRGKLSAVVGSGGSRRSIPAWAGETAPNVEERNAGGVYPRVGGGNVSPRHHPATSRGLSPRGRGKRWRLWWAAVSAGSIPAWAGETYTTGVACGRLWVYPRVGGGNHNRRQPLGVSRGLSPRGRGKQRRYECAHKCCRSIPAWAGETISGIPAY